METPQHTEQKGPQDRDVRENKDIAAVSYLWFLSIVIYLARKDSPFVQYHAKQGMVLFLISIPLWFIPVIGHLLEFLVLAGMVMGFLNAFQGQWADVPFIGGIAKGETTPLQALRAFWEACKKLFRGAVKEAKKKPEESSAATKSRSQEQASQQEKDVPPPPASSPSSPPSSPPSSHE